MENLFTIVVLTSYIKKRQAEVLQREQQAEFQGKIHNLVPFLASINPITTTHCGCPSLFLLGMRERIETL